MQVAVADIKPNPLQPRAKNPDVKDLADSMAKVGLVQPIVVAKQGDSYLLIAGHCRLAAAKKLKWEHIEADVVNLADPKFDIARIMAENEVRTDLTGKERALGYQTMIDHGWSDKDMSAVSGADAEELALARKVATATKKLVSMMPDQSSLEEMAALAEFATDPKAYSDLVKNVGRDEFAHRLSYQRQERERVIKVDTAMTKLEADGVRVIAREKSWEGGVLMLRDYRMKEAKVDPETHASCPGHCATVDHNGLIEYHCDQPKLHGIEAGNRGPKSEKEKELDKRKRTMRALWRASVPVRQDFVKAMLRVKPLDTGLLDWAYSWAVQHGVSSFDLHNTRSKEYTISKDVRLRFVASCVAAAEYGFDQWVINRGALGDPGYHTLLAGYLKVLVKMDYPISAHEKAVVDGKEFVTEPVTEPVV